MDINKAKQVLICSQGCCGRVCNDCKEAHNMALEALEIINKEEQGHLFKFPIKVGDKVYRPVPVTYRTYTTLTVCKIIIEEDDIFFKDDCGLTWNLNTIGKTIFLTKEEAEQKLKELIR